LILHHYKSAVFGLNCIRLSTSICLSICTYQHCSHFREIWCWSLWKSVEKIKIWLQLDKNIGHLTWRPK